MANKMNILGYEYTSFRKGTKKMGIDLLILTIVGVICIIIASGLGYQIGYKRGAEHEHYSHVINQTFDRLKRRENHEDI